LALGKLRTSPEVENSNPPGSRSRGNLHAGPNLLLWSLDRRARAIHGEFLAAIEVGRQ
jgi:hypothetical protein